MTPSTVAPIASASTVVTTAKGRKEPWKHPSERRYLSSLDWSQDKVIQYLRRTAFTVPPRTGNHALVAISRPGEKMVTHLPNRYRTPLMFVGRFLWESLRLVLMSPNPLAEWDEFKFDIIHLARLCTGLFDAADVAGKGDSGTSRRGRSTRIGAVDRSWRCPMFDRALTRFWYKWMNSQPQYVQEFWESFGEEEYENDVLKRDWGRWALRGHKGFILTKEELENGITNVQYMRGLQKRGDAWVWESSSPAAPPASSSTIPSAPSPTFSIPDGQSARDSETQKLAGRKRGREEDASPIRSRTHYRASETKKSKPTPNSDTHSPEIVIATQVSHSATPPSGNVPASALASIASSTATSTPEPPVSSSTVTSLPSQPILSLVKRSPSPMLVIDSNPSGLIIKPAPAVVKQKLEELSVSFGKKMDSAVGRFADAIGGMLKEDQELLEKQAAQICTPSVVEKPPPPSPSPPPSLFPPAPAPKTPRALELLRDLKEKSEQLEQIVTKSPQESVLEPLLEVTSALQAISTHMMEIDESQKEMNGVMVEVMNTQNDLLKEELSSTEEEDRNLFGEWVEGQMKQVVELVGNIRNESDMLMKVEDDVNPSLQGLEEELNKFRDGWEKFQQERTEELAAERAKEEARGKEEEEKAKVEVDSTKPGVMQFDDVGVQVDREVLKVVPPVHSLRTLDADATLIDLHEHQHLRPQGEKRMGARSESMLLTSLLDELQDIKQHIRENDERTQDEVAKLRRLHSEEIRNLRNGLTAREEMDARRIQHDIERLRERGWDRDRNHNRARNVWSESYYPDAEVSELKRRIAYLEADARQGLSNSKRGFDRLETLKGSEQSISR